VQKGKTTETGARAADRNELAANWFTISRSVWKMHDALLLEQRRTNQLLEALLVASGGEIPDPSELPNPTVFEHHNEIDPSTGMPISQVRGYEGA
jgi:hypothetical protein